MIGPLPAPWSLLTEDQLLTTFEVELAREVAPGHALANLTGRIIAKRDDCDDVLVALNDGRVAVVHLTWSGRREADTRWPTTTIYESLENWRLAADR
jgi:ABC-type amino acid transport substrate-binding protein